MNTKLSINILGVMSGTSLDGLDLALCQFYEEENNIQFKIIEAKTFHFSLQWQNKLQQLVNASAKEYKQSDIAFGNLIGEYVNKFKAETPYKIDYIASHGHTIFHEPEQGFTAQLGDANAIMAKTGISTITDFRQLDVQFGGTGAPLVPIGDRDLFPKSVCINLGGICNLSYLDEDKMVALDLCPFNIPLNFIAKKLGANYDNNGIWARSGSLIPELLDELNKIDYFKKAPPKSLDKTWVEHIYFPIIEAALKKYLEADILNTLVKHYTLQVQSYLVKN